MRRMQGHSEENVTLKTAQTLIHSKCAIYMPGGAYLAVYALRGFV